MTRYRVFVGLALVSLIAGAAGAAVASVQSLTYRCGTVKNHSDFTIVVYVRSAQASPIPVTIGPHDSGQVCAGR